MVAYEDKVVLGAWVPCRRSCVSESESITRGQASLC